MSYQKSKAVLNQLVADLSQFATIIHQTHWYMRGEDFLTLHPKMDEYMDEINDQLDEVAERLITIGGAPYSTLAEFAAHTNLGDETGTYQKSTEERMARLVEGYRYLQALYGKGIEVSGEEGDDVTQDMLIACKGAVEKNIWMLQAKLGKSPEVDTVEIEVKIKG
ncbi:DNA starvation/stationary phase protection protein [Vagococcus entomophilus]|uniref:DNA starvation/stationary phase protection protein n=1 Tax=Vagococcus entomophilus TaxID=1160095 RepID=A0A430AGZ4_9ENTE|nr:Dps family protein [Vagococcus entomophilus]RSU07124.1 DNA starvation/stationary phase protection protein [Vagococcus entomophilus]